MDVSISKDSRFVSIWFLMFESIVFEGRFDWICMFGSLHSNSSSGLAVVDGFEFFF